jgi:Ca-activated chloride channel homolog
MMIDRLLGPYTFANPEALLLLGLIPLYLFWYVRYYRRQRLVIRLSYDPAQGKNPAANLAFLRFIPRVFQLLALGLLIVAIARPQKAEEVVSEQVNGIDLCLTIDVSGSMEGQDFLPNRLEAAKRLSSEFVESRAHDRIGIVLFGAKALSYSPLTVDHTFLQRLIRNIRFNLLPQQGSALSEAILMSLNRLEEGQASTKVLVLLTDGAYNQGPASPLTAARLAREQGVRIYAVGLGPAQAPVLQQLARITGGRYFPAQDSRQLQAALSEIDRLETSPIEEERRRLVEDHYPLFLQIAIFLLALAFLSMLTFVYNPLEQ